MVRADELLSARCHVWLLCPEGVKGARPEGRVDDDNCSANITGNSNFAPASRIFNSDWFVNSFIMFVDETFLKFNQDLVSEE